MLGPKGKAVTSVDGIMPSGSMWLRGCMVGGCLVAAQLVYTGTVVACTQPKTTTWHMQKVGQCPLGHHKASSGNRNRTQHLRLLNQGAE